MRLSTIALLLGLVAVAALVMYCHLRMRRIREREQLSRQVEDALVQNAQGLILNVHGIVKDLPDNDPRRQRVEEALDRADQQLSTDRDQVQQLRQQAALDTEGLVPKESGPRK